MSWMDVEPFLVALAIGLLLGFERERSHIRTLPAGSRSFALLSLAGAVAAGFDIWAVSAGIVVVGLLLALAYLRTSEQDAGTTTEIAALVAYLLGALAYTDPSVAVALAVIVAGLLMSKSRIHRFARQMVSEIELEDAIKFLVAAFVVLPLLPDREIGPYGVLNPAKVWLLVVLLTGIGWIGYIGVRTLGPQRGLLVTGLAGGFVSASATTASMGRLSRTADEMRAPLAGALVASLATFIQLLVVIGFVEPDVLRRLWPPVVAGAMVLVVVAAIVYRGASVASRDAEVMSVGAEPNTAARPFSLRPALVLAAVLVFALFVGRWGADVLGSRGAGLAAAAAGLADAHAGALGAASLAAKGTITVDSALQAIAAALGSNLLVKSVLAFTSGEHRFGLGFLAAMVLPTVVFAVVMTFVVTMG
ncbi:MgtC/SapB family protein [Rhodococcoides fascians]|uniref:MgtC/SapB family protein n=1 Tax=Rhodococcoides fascians TaxID=1828 RepID=UPI0035300736